MPSKSLSIILTVCLLTVGGTLKSADSKPLIKEGDRLAILGDSITEGKIYTVYIDSYILACSGLKDVKVFQFGWGGDTAKGMAARLEHDVIAWNPTFLTTCYGMNDGACPYDESKVGEPYRQAMSKIISVAKANKARILVGSPGVVDSYFAAAGPYKMNVNEKNDCLHKLTEICKALADGNKEYFADLHHPMLDAMTKSKAAFGEKYSFAGGDGIHPSYSGHLVMAYVFLKAMGFDGKIAEIEMDWNSDTKVSEGHKIISQSQGTAEIESTRYPFCFNISGQPGNASNISTILPYVGFQNDLNRFMLSVKNLPSEKAEVAWGESKKEFSKAALEKGINLANEFLSVNPFSKQFNCIANRISTKEAYETVAIKNYMNCFRDMLDRFKDDPEIEKYISLLKTRIFTKHDELDSIARKEYIPVRHTIKITPK